MLSIDERFFLRQLGFKNSSSSSEDISIHTVSPPCLCLCHTIHFQLIKSTFYIFFSQEAAVLSLAGSRFYPNVPENRARCTEVRSTRRINWLVLKAEIRERQSVLIIGGVTSAVLTQRNHPNSEESQQQEFSWSTQRIERGPCSPMLKMSQYFIKDIRTWHCIKEGSYQHGVFQKFDQCCH